MWVKNENIEKKIKNPKTSISHKHWGAQKGPKIRNNGLEWWSRWRWRWTTVNRDGDKQETERPVTNTKDEEKSDEGTEMWAKTKIDRWTYKNQTKTWPETFRGWRRRLRQFEKGSGDLRGRSKIMQCVVRWSNLLLHPQWVASQFSIAWKFYSNLPHEKIFSSKSGK